MSARKKPGKPAAPKKKAAVKKAAPRYKKNPALRDLQNAAIARYESFTGHTADSYQKVPLPDLSALVLIGEIEAIAYNTVRDGERGRYLHPFKKGARPLLCVAADGKSFIALGGNFEFGPRGFEDKA